MIEWSDQAIVLSARPYGENKVLCICLTQTHGRHAGLVHGGRQLKAVLEPGNLVNVTWKARLLEQLGTYKVEPVQNYAVSFFQDSLKLLALQSACALAGTALPERETHTALFNGFLVLLSALENFEFDLWGVLYVRWELGLLKELGFALDPADFLQTDHIAAHLHLTQNALFEHVFSVLNKPIPDVRKRLLEKI